MQTAPHKQNTFLVKFKFLKSRITSSTNNSYTKGFMIHAKSGAHTSKNLQRRAIMFYICTPRYTRKMRKDMVSGPISTSMHETDILGNNR